MIIDYNIFIIGLAVILIVPLIVWLIVVIAIIKHYRKK